MVSVSVCVCMDAMMQSNMLVFADLCGSDSCKITGPVLGPGSHQVWISSIISAHKALLTIDDQLCGQLGLLIVNFLWKLTVNVHLLSQG